MRQRETIWRIFLHTDETAGLIDSRIKDWEEGLTTMQYWQIGIGDGRVDMAEIFIKLNVALLGPGRSGDYFDNRESYEQLSDGHLVKKFAEEIQIGDILVLKHIENPQTKTWRIHAVGEVVGPYRYEPIFDSVDKSGWDVQHCRRVRWKKPPSDLIVAKGGAPIRLQRLEDDNPMKICAEELFINGTNVSAGTPE